MSVTTCPDDEKLAQLLSGRLQTEEAEQYETHLAHCQRCAERAAELSVPDELAGALRDTQTTEQTVSHSDGSIVAGLIERLSGLPNAPNLAQLPTADELRSVLRPAEGEDELGRIGNYRIVEVLGAGAMGIVFRAEDEQLGRQVAVKVMRPHLATNRDACLRFRREACAVAAFEHNHVVTIYHVGEDQGTPYFAMQLLEGESLRSRLVRCGRLAVNDVLRIGREIAEGLEAAHRRGLLHRDIKPDNVWLDADGEQVRIVDFGLARVVDQAPSITHAGAIMGTPNYMAPEQIRGDAIDHRCDLFSLGSLLYHAATGEIPFSGNNVVATLIAVSQDEATPPQTLNPDLPEALCGLILQLLEKDPQKRPQSASEVIDRMAAIQQQLSEHVLPAQPPRRGRFTRWLMAAAGSLTLGAAVILYVATDKGTLVVEADDAVAVSVEQGAVNIRDRATGREWIAKIGKNQVRAGSYEIVVKEKDSDIVISAPELSILRGERRKVHLSLKTDSAAESAPSVSAAEEALPRENRQTPEWLSETDDSLNIKPGQPLSPLALVSQPAPLDNVLSWTVEPADHRSLVNDFAFSSDGALVATAGQDGTVRIWTTDTRELQRIIVCPGSVDRLAWSNDGRYLASSQQSGAGSVCIWELSDSATRLVKRINRGSSELAWSSDGKYLAFASNGVEIWDFGSGEIVTSFGIAGRISRRCWSAEGSLLAAMPDDGGIALWDVERRQFIARMAGDGQPRYDAIWARQGPFLLCARGRTQQASQGEQSSGPTAYSVEVWDLPKNQRIRDFPVGTSKYGMELSWSPDESTVLTRLRDAISITLWDVKTGARLSEPFRSDKPFDRAGFGKCSAIWSPNPQAIGLLRNGVVGLGNVSTSESQQLAGRRDVIHLKPGSFLSDQGLLAVEKSLDTPHHAIWDLRQLKSLLRVSGSEMPRLLLSPDGKTVAEVPWEVQGSGAQSRDLEVQFIDLVTMQRETAKLDVEGLDCRLVAAWSPDSRRLAVQNDRTGKVFLLDRAKVVLASSYSQDRGRISERQPWPTWSPDSQLVACLIGMRGGGVQLLMAQSGKMLHTLTLPAVRRGGEIGNREYAWAGSSGSPDALAWSFPGTHVAECYRSTLQGNAVAVWRVSGDQVKPFAEHGDENGTMPEFFLSGDYVAGAPMFSPDGQLMASGAGGDSTGGIGVWESESGKSVAEIRTPCSTVAYAGWLPDSRHMFFGGESLVGVIDVTTGEVNSTVFQLEKLHESIANATSWVHSGSTLAVSYGGSVIFYDASLRVMSTIVLPALPEAGALSIQPTGAFRAGPNAPQPRVIALADGVQRTLTPDEFSHQYGWQNQPMQLDFQPSP